MTDLVLAYNPEVGGFDLVLTDTDLAVDDGFTGACILSVYADRRAHADDPLPKKADRRGWWGDRVQPLARPQAGASTNPDRIGSRLWLFEREVQSAVNLVRAKKILTEAFAWLTEDGYVSKVDIITWYPRVGRLGWRCVATWPDGTTSSHTYETEWGAV
jgi:phage gp46-like protein